MSAQRRVRMRFGMLLAGVLLAGCSWSNRANRPVWNAFEEHLVPAHDGAFYASLPLTVPLGLLAIVTDALVAHPIQVLDDAAGDAASLWRENGPDFARTYYTEMAFLPVRAVATPLFFAGSFAGRVLFDIPERLPEAERKQRAKRRELARHRRQVERFREQLELAMRGSARRFVTVPAEWDRSLDEPLRQALAGSASVRLTVHRWFLANGFVRHGSYDAEVGLRDPDPVVRFTVLRDWPSGADRPSPAVLEVVRTDPVESVRELAMRRFPR